MLRWDEMRRGAEEKKTGDWGISGYGDMGMGSQRTKL
jgi:hypothetical protein